jgi:hypothetical protein
MKDRPKQERQDGPMVNILPLAFMVAGVGFEPTAFGLWVWRMVSQSIILRSK